MDKIKKIKVLLGMVKQEFETARLMDGSEISFDALEINREVYNADGEPLKEGEYTLEDGTIIVVDLNGVIKEIRKADGETEKEEVVEEMADEKPAEDTNDPDTVKPSETDKPSDEETETVVTVKVVHPADPNKIVKVNVKEGEKVNLPSGEYTDTEGNYIIAVENGKVVKYRSLKAPESVISTDDVVIKKELEDRVANLESKVDEMYNILLQIADKEREREERIETIKEEFASIKSNPSAQPLFVSTSNESKPLSKIEKLKRLKNQ